MLLLYSYRLFSFLDFSLICLFLKSTPDLCYSLILFLVVALVLYCFAFSTGRGVRGAHHFFSIASLSLSSRPSCSSHLRVLWLQAFASGTVRRRGAIATLMSQVHTAIGKTSVPVGSKRIPFYQVPCFSSIEKSGHDGFRTIVGSSIPGIRRDFKCFVPDLKLFIPVNLSGLGPAMVMVDSKGKSWVNVIRSKVCRGSFSLN